MTRPGPEQDIAAARSLAAELGLGGIEPQILRLARHTVVRLGGRPLVARVQSAPPLDRAFETMARELAVARHLVRKGAPAVPPSVDPAPGVYRREGCVISLWAHVDHRAANDGDAELAGSSLKAVHEALASFDDPLPPFTDAVASAGRLLDDPAALGGLSPFDREFLAERFGVAFGAADWAALPSRPLHGDTQFGNLFITEHGPLWGDFEAVCAGPLEWDLAGRPPAMQVAFALDPELLRALTTLRRACLVIWCWDEADRSAEVRAAAEYHLRRLKRTRG